MIRIHLPLAGPVVALGVAGLLGCSSKPASPPPKPLTELVVKRVTADISKPDPNAAYWNGMAEGVVTLTAQAMINPRPETTNTQQLYVKAVTDGKLAAFRIRWADTEISEAGRLGEFSDALALEFPIELEPLPPVMMGAKDQPVHIFHWRAQYQRDHEVGKPAMNDLYPNLSIDMYPMEFEGEPGQHVDGREQFSPGLAEGNPQSYEKTGVDEIIAEGFSTSSVRIPAEGDHAHGEWKDGYWTLVIVRPLVIQYGSILLPGPINQIGFAAWQGGLGEVASRKSITMMWTPMVVQ